MLSETAALCASAATVDFALAAAVDFALAAAVEFSLATAVEFSLAQRPLLRHNLCGRAIGAAYATTPDEPVWVFDVHTLQHDRARTGLLSRARNQPDKARRVPRDGRRPRARARAKQFRCCCCLAPSGFTPSVRVGLHRHKHVRLPEGLHRP